MLYLAVGLAYRPGSPEMNPIDTNTFQFKFFNWFPNLYFRIRSIPTKYQGFFLSDSKRAKLYYVYRHIEVVIQYS